MRVIRVNLHWPLVHEGLLSTAGRRPPLREHRWPGGQWRV